MLVPTTKLNAIPTAFIDLTPDDLKYIKRHTGRLLKSLRKKYEALDRAHDVIIKRVTPIDKATFIRTPRARIKFLRAVDAENYVVDAVLDLEFTIVKPRTKRELAIWDLEKDPGVSERRLVMSATLTRPGTNIEIDLPQVAIGKVPSAAEAFFDQLLATRLLKSSKYRHIPVPPYSNDNAPDLTGADLLAAENLSYLQRPDRVKDITPPKTKPGPVSQKRRQWEPDERFVRQQVAGIRQAFARSVKGVFSTIDFAVNHKERKLRVELRTRGDLGRRYFNLHGHYDFSRTSNGEKDPISLHWTPQSDATIPANSLNGKPTFDLTDFETASAEILYFLTSECGLVLPAKKASSDDGKPSFQRVRPSSVGRGRRSGMVSTIR